MDKTLVVYVAFKKVSDIFHHVDADAEISIEVSERFETEVMVAKNILEKGRSFASYGIFREVDPPKGFVLFENQRQFFCKVIVKEVFAEVKVSEKYVLSDSTDDFYSGEGRETVA